VYLLVHKWTTVKSRYINLEIWTACVYNKNNNRKFTQTRKMVPGRNACLWESENGVRETPGWGCKPFAIFWAVCILLMTILLGIIAGKEGLVAASPLGGISVMMLVIFWVYCQDCDGWKGLWFANFASIAVSILLVIFGIGLFDNKQKRDESEEKKIT
jgi:hypothetical protein